MSVAHAPAPMGHNAPPAGSFEAFDAHLGDLFTEARNFLDGAGVNTEAEAEAVSKLLDMIRTAGKDADKARAAEKKPHDDAGKAVQAKWKPLLDRAEMATDTCKRVLGPWLRKQQEAALAAAAEARRVADAAAQAAAEASRQTDVTDLTAREAAEALVKDAKRAEAEAAKAEKVRPQATGGARATTLRTHYRAELTDASAALRHYVAQQPEAIKACLLSLAETDVRAGKMQIPGVTVIADDRVV